MRKRHQRRQRRRQREAPTEIETETEAESLRQSGPSARTSISSAGATCAVSASLARVSVD